MEITDIKLGEYKKYENCVGDTWDPAWADDDCIYSPGNDGTGWDSGCSSNLYMNKCSGDDYLELQGKTINGMAEYGKWGLEGPDECTCKSSGCISIDGTLYLALARHKYGSKSGDPYFRQTANGGNIIRSTDHGLTWQRSAQENYDRPMFPGQRFSTPYFIHYGRDGIAPAVDNAEKFVYAVSNNGFWCNGDNYILGRVERSRISGLNPGDWQFYTGGDGLDGNSWSQSMDNAVHIIDNPLKCGETGATYIPSIERYILVAWYYPGNPNIDTQETHFIYYAAPHPWGPWTSIKEDVINPEGWYCPRVLSKWQRRKEDEIEAVIVTGGDYYEIPRYYKFTVVPIQLKTAGKFPTAPMAGKKLIINDDEIGEGLNKFNYSGSWYHEKNRLKAHNSDEHYSYTANDHFTIEFHGSRIGWYASKADDWGVAAVSIDGGEEAFVDLYTYCTSIQYGRCVFDSGALKEGHHSMKVRVTGDKGKGKGTFVFNDFVEITYSS